MTYYNYFRKGKQPKTEGELERYPFNVPVFLDGTTLENATFVDFDDQVWTKLNRNTASWTKISRNQ